MDLMHTLQVQKFKKNPELIDKINEAGGLEFIKQSSHIVGVKGSRWEGRGMNSNFIKVLARSYETVAKELGKFKEAVAEKNEETPTSSNHPYLKKIISGGQTGGDRGGLLAGRALGIETGGTAPKGWKTDNGSDPSLAEFGIKEHASSHYVPRTMQNVDDAGATIAFLWGKSIGTDKTIGYAQTGDWKYGRHETTLNGHRPVAVIKTKNPEQAAIEIKEFLQKTKAEVINIAGHREKSQPGIEEFVQHALILAINPEIPLPKTPSSNPQPLLSEQPQKKSSKANPQNPFKDELPFY